ncbi:hypothetical protein ACQE32_04220 [Pantoea sp. FN0302]|uniref:hypothetical protein n=1 Tax=unclassified Pantoea TaxID=2630326 RepID=UPI003CEFB5C1
MAGKLTGVACIAFTGVAAFSNLCLADELDLYSLHTASFAYHLYSPTKDYNQYFKNNLIAVERRVNENSDYSLYAGTMINSEGNRCALLGFEKDWGTYNNLTIEGIYLYAGEFWFKSFSNCGDKGMYQDIKKMTGVGFAPYIYHGVKYEMNPHVNFRSGVLLPGILVLSLQLKF